MKREPIRIILYLAYDTPTLYRAGLKVYDVETKDYFMHWDYHLGHGNEIFLTWWSA
jgi:hypothetical protein